MSFLLLIAAYFIAFLFVLYGLWMLLPRLHGLPWVPTRKTRIRKGLEMAKLQPDELLYDLGAGDGRVLFLAAEEFGARAIGIEAAWMQYIYTLGRIFLNGQQAKIGVRRENFYQADVSNADVVFAFFTSREVAKIQEHLKNQMKPGSRLVAVSADFPLWKPVDFYEQELIFVYEMPPQEGGLIAYLAEQEEGTPFLEKNFLFFTKTVGFL